jgi:hypothetical protein
MSRVYKEHRIANVLVVSALASFSIGIFDAGFLVIDVYTGNGSMAPAGGALALTLVYHQLPVRQISCNPEQ